MRVELLLNHFCMPFVYMAVLSPPSYILLRIDFTAWVTYLPFVYLVV